MLLKITWEKYLDNMDCLSLIKTIYIMRRITLLLLFTITTTAFSQVQTTQEEYNYLSRGLKIQIESGLDTKNGYSFEKFHTRKVASYQFDFSYLIKSDIKKPVAISLIAKSNGSGVTYYFAIPLNNLKLLENYYSAISTLDKAMTTALALAVSDALMLNSK